MKILLIICSFCFLVSCSQEVQVQSQTEVQNNSVQDIKKPKEDKILEKLSKPLEKIRLPEIKKIGEFSLIRNSETKDKNGWMILPYINAEIKMGFENEPQIGEKVTVIPRQVKLEPFQLEISKVTKTINSGCVENNEKDFFWSIELETIIDKEILEIESVKNYPNQMPFSVFVIYPSVKFAKSLDKSVISKTILPKNVPSKRIESAIDLDNDSKPDLLSVRFCCGEPNKESDEECPYICQKYYKKTNGVWKLFDTNDFQEIC